MIFDTHTHIYTFDDVHEVITRAIKSGVALIMLPSDNIIEAKKAYDLALKYDFIYCAGGIHPEEVNYLNLSNTISSLRSLIQSSSKFKAVGEIGLDYHYGGNKELQKEFFISQIEMANELKLPIIIHSRDSAYDSLKIVKDNLPKYGFVFHCFSYSVEVMREVIALGGYIGLDGPVTYKNAISPKKVAKEVPLDRLLIETDAPYLTPVPYRGKRNEPSYITEVIKEIALIREMTFDELANITYSNGKRFFRI